MRKLLIRSLLVHSLIKDLASLTYKDAVRRGLQTPFVVFISFLISFGAVRAIAYSFPSFNIVGTIRGYYIHHFYLGIALIIISNWIVLISNRRRPILVAAVLFGVGLGSLADEIGLLLTCTSPQMLQCDYKARITLDFFIIVVGVFLSILYFMPLWRRFRRIALHTPGAIYGRIRRA